MKVTCGFYVVNKKHLNNRGRCIVCHAKEGSELAFDKPVVRSED